MNSSGAKRPGRFLRRAAPRRAAPRRAAPAVIGAILFATLLAATAWRSATDSVDFPIYHQAGRQILNGEYELYPAGLYTNQPGVPGHGFRYAPAVALLFVPLALLPLEGAAFLFFCLKVAAFAHTFIILSRRLHSPVLRLAVAALFVTGGYVLEDFRGGNLQFLVVYAMVLAFDQAERHRIGLPAVVLAVAIAAKITPLALLGYFILKRRWAVAVVTLATLGLLVAGPAAIWGARHNNHLIDGFVKYSKTTMDSPVSARNYSLRGVLLKYQPFGMSPATANTLWIVILGASAAVFAVITWRRTAGEVSPDLQFALLLTCIPLLSPHSQRIYFSTLCVPAAILVSLLRHNTAPLRPAVIGALLLTSAASTVLPAVLMSKSLSRAYLDLSPYSFAALLMWLVLVAVVLRPRPGISETFAYH